MSDPAPDTPLSSRAATVPEAVAAWTAHLVDLGGPNTLLWQSEPAADTLDLTTAHPGGVAKLMAGRPTLLSDLVRESGARDATLTRVRAIADHARDLHERRGLVSSFLAVGTATWTVHTPAGQAPRVPRAPVLLRRCTLRALGPARHDYVLDLDSRVELNPALVHYFATSHGIDLDGLAADLADRGGALDPYPTYAALRAACAQVPGFVVEPRLTLGLLSHAKLPMVADVTLHRDALTSHPLVAALAGDDDARTALRQAGGHPEADVAAPDPADEVLVLDADATQRAAVQAVLRGANLALHTPPGTGATQTIAAMVAALAADGRTTLLVSPRRTSLDAVLARLERVGLGDLVLDLPGGPLDRDRAAADLAAALSAPPGDTPAASPETTAALREHTTALSDHLDALHAERAPWGVSAHDVHEAIGTLAARTHPPHSRVRVDADELAALTPTRRDELIDSLVGVAEAGGWSLERVPDPWFGARIATTEEADEARTRLERVRGDAIEDLGRTIEEVFAGLTLPPTTTVRDWGELVTQVSSIRDTLEIFTPHVFDLPRAELVAATGTAAERQRAGVDLGWFERRALRAQARRLLRPGTPPRDLHAELARAEEQRVAWKAMAGAGGRPEIPADLDRAHAAYARVAADLEWLEARLARPDSAPALLDLDRGVLVELLEALAATPDRLAVLPEVTTPVAELTAAGLGPLVDDLARRAVAPADVASEAEFVWWASLGEEIARRDRVLAAHDGEALRAHVTGYAAADRALLAEHAATTRSRVRARARAAADAHRDQADLVREEATTSRLGLPGLLERAADVALAARPVWSMSPLVVASVVPPSTGFDVVIVEHAEQLAPAEVVSALARARQVVLVGDAHVSTLPAGLSALDALAPALTELTLTREHRALDERLLDAASSTYPDLDTTPSAVTSPVVTRVLEPATGVLAPGQDAIESTPAEVERVVALALEHARTRPTESLAVVALNAAHAALVADALRRAVTGLEEREAGFFADDVFERCVVTDPAGMAGESRDAVIVTVGYAPTPHGRVLHRFGALGEPGGERLVTIATTRARRRMTVVTTLTPDHLDPAKLTSPGSRALRDLLAYAARLPSAATSPELGASAPPGPDATGQPGRGAQDRPGPDVEDRLGPVLAEFADRLRREGFTVTGPVGERRDVVELAVTHPAHPGRVIAVETDGTAYAARSDIRERERLRPERLERLGWTPLRLWVTDVFRDPAREVERVRAAIEAGS